jgi:2-polyprenyl-3-methyl-5-hydroxy-6-metoxy-1,4-benzoquinol methylase
MSEKQYAGYENLPRESLGLRANVWWQTDPRSLLFSMARYEFVAKMLSGKKRVLEVGCGDAWCTRLVKQEAGHILAVDFDETFITDANACDAHGPMRWHIAFRVHDILTGPLVIPMDFDAAYALDVLEHIAPENEHTFLKNVADSLRPGGVFIVGTPSLESQAYASAGSKEGHINCKTGPQLMALMGEYFENVFPFSMNDAAIYPGFSPMARYYFAIGAGVRNV